MILYGVMKSCEEIGGRVLLAGVAPIVEQSGHGDDMAGIQAGAPSGVGSALQR